MHLGQMSVLATCTVPGATPVAGVVQVVQEGTDCTPGRTLCDVCASTEPSYREEYALKEESEVGLSVDRLIAIPA